MTKMNIIAISLLAVASMQGETGYKVTGRYPLPGTGGWDYVSIDSSARRIYVSHVTQVEVVDADSGKLVGTIPDTPGVHGAAVATGMDRGFTSNGGEDKVTIFDTKTLKVIEKISVGKGPDGIYYEPTSKRIFTNNHGSHDITAIDAKTGKVVGTVAVAGDGEQAIFGTDGMVYVNLEDKAEVAVFDPKTLEVKKRFKIGVAETPTGLAYDAKTNRLFIGLRKEPMMVVMDAANGKVVGHFPIGAGVDFAAFDVKNQLVLFSCGAAGSISAFRVKSADEYEDAGAIPTQVTAKTMAFDTKTGKIFLPAATVETVPPAVAGGRPTRKNSDFVVLVVSR